MTVIDKLATSLNRRDEVPNQQLAKELITTKDKKAIQELVDSLSNKDKNISSDCLKVLYEIGEKEPTLISNYAEDFLNLLDSTNNRLVWGAMTAIDSITSQNPQLVFKNLSKIMKVANAGSVITKDHGVRILIQLLTHKEYENEAFNFFKEILKTCPTNQLPMYAENSMLYIPQDKKAKFVLVLKKRLIDVEKETKKKRIEKVINKLS